MTESSNLVSSVTGQTCRVRRASPWVSQEGRWPVRQAASSTFLPAPVARSRLRSPPRGRAALPRARCSSTRPRRPGSRGPPPRLAVGRSPATTSGRTGFGTSTTRRAPTRRPRGSRSPTCSTTPAPTKRGLVAFVHDLSGAAGFGTKTITVTAISGTTYYVSTSGSDGANGLTTSTALRHHRARAVRRRRDQLTPVLLRSSDTFSLSSATALGETGTLRGSAPLRRSQPRFCNGARTSPITLTGAFASAFTMSGTDVRVTNIFFDLPANTVGAPGNIFAGATGVNTTSWSASRRRSIRTAGR